MKDKRQRMTVAWPYGLTDPGIYAYLMTAAAQANMNGYPYPALQSAIQSFNPYYPAGALPSNTTRPTPYPTYNHGNVTARDNLFHKSTNSLLDTMSSLSQASLLQQSMSKNSHLPAGLVTHQPNSGGLVMSASPHTSVSSGLLGSLFQPFKE